VKPKTSETLIGAKTSNPMLQNSTSMSFVNKVKKRTSNKTLSTKT